jgi:hypothetical protein
MERDAEEEGESGVGFWMNILFDYFKSLLVEYYAAITNFHIPIMEDTKSPKGLAIGGIISVSLTLVIFCYLLYSFIVGENIISSETDITMITVSGIIVGFSILSFIASIIILAQKKKNRWAVILNTISIYCFIGLLIISVGSFLIVASSFFFLLSIITISVVFIYTLRHAPRTSIILLILLSMLYVHSVAGQFRAQYCYDKIGGYKPFSVEYDACSEQFEWEAALQEKYLSIENTDMVIPTSTPPPSESRTPAGSDRDVPGNIEQ